MWIFGTSRACQNLWHTVNNIDFHNSVTCLQICTTCRTSQASSTVLLKSLESQDSILYFSEWHNTHTRPAERTIDKLTNNLWLSNAVSGLRKTARPRISRPLPAQPPRRILLASVRSRGLKSHLLKLVKSDARRISLRKLMVFRIEMN